MANNMGEFTVSDEKLREFLKALFPNKTSDEIEEMLKNPTLIEIYASQYVDACRNKSDPIAIAKRAAELKKSEQIDPTTQAAYDRRTAELKEKIEASKTRLSELESYMNGGRGRK